MSLSRRALLVTGAASVVVLGGAGSWLTTRTSVSARKPWDLDSKSFGDPRLDALAYAILAPSPHNMQPWRVRLEGDDALTVFADSDRLLPATDPPARQTTIGFGAFLELLRQAAAQGGHALAVKPFPEGEPYPTLDERPVAQVQFRKDAAVERDPLFAQILRRRTTRAVFAADRPVDPGTLTGIIEAATEGVHVQASGDPLRVRELRDLTAKAWLAEWQDPAARGETVVVTRIGKAEVGKAPWGITLDGPLMSTLGALGVVTREGMDTPGTAAYKGGVESYLDACKSAMAHLWSTTATNTRLDQLAAGATWVRLQQAATREGVAFHPLSQPLQEFPAMASHYAWAHAMLAPEGHTVQMLVRLGYAEAPAQPAPREALESKLLPLNS